MKRIISLLLSLILIGTIIFVPTHANAVSSGTCGIDGDNLTWTLDETGTLTISGTGEMSDTDGVPNWYHSRISKVVIEDGVTSIGKNAFNWCNRLSSVVFADTIIKIGSHAFDDCDNLTTVDLPDNLEHIETGAFYGCDKLTNLYIPENVKTIDGNFFYNCNNLTEIKVDSNNECFSVRNNVLYDKDLTKIIGCPKFISDTFDIPESVKVIGKYAFSYDTKLTNINISGNVETIEYGAFDECTGLKSLIIPESVINIDSYAFRKCENIISIKLPSKITKISEGLFCYCYKLESIDIPNGVTDIGNWAFHECKKLTIVNFPQNLINIGNNAFHSTGILYIDLPENVVNIDYSAFSYCRNLLIASIPKSVTSVGYNLFEECTNLKTVNLYNDVLSDNMFKKCESLENVNFFGKIKLINEFAFMNCTSIKNIIIPERVEEIKRQAFDHCSSLENIVLPNSLKIIDVWTFNECRKLQQITIPDNVKDINGGYNVFENCTSLETINVSENNQYYSSDDGVLFNKTKTVLYCCPEGKSGKYTIPNTVTDLSIWPFYHCEELTAIEVPGSLKCLGHLEFRACYDLKYLIIHRGVGEIYTSAFRGCSNLTDIYYEGSKEEWDSIVVTYEDSIDNVTIHYNSNGPNNNPDIEENNPGDTYDTYHVRLSYPKKFYVIEDKTLPGTPSTKKSEYAEELYEWAKEFGYDAAITPYEAQEIINKYMPTTVYMDNSMLLTADEYTTYDIMRDIIMLNSTLKSVNLWEDEYLKNVDVIDLNKTTDKIKKITEEYTEYISSVERNPMATVIYNIYSQKLVNAAGKYVYKVTKSQLIPDVEMILEEGGINELYSQMTESIAAWKDSGLGSLSGIPSDVYEELKSKSAKTVASEVFKTFINDLGDQYKSVAVIQEAASATKSYISGFKSTSLIAQFAPNTLFEVQLLKLGQKVFETINNVKSAQYFMINYYFKHNAPNIYNKIVDSNGDIVDYIDWIMLINSGEYEISSFANNLMQNWYNTNGNLVDGVDRLELMSLSNNTAQIQLMDINSLRKSVVEYWAEELTMDDKSNNYQIQYTFHKDDSFEIQDSNNSTLGYYNPVDGYKQNFISLASMAAMSDHDEFTVTRDNENSSVCVTTLDKTIKIVAVNQTHPSIVTIVNHDGDVYSLAYQNKNDKKIIYTITSDIIIGIDDSGETLEPLAEYNNNQSRIDLDTNNTEIGYSAGENADNVRSNIELESGGLYGSIITWESNNENIINSDGVVSRPDETQHVSMTATISNGDAHKIKSFELKVIGTDITVDFDTMGGSGVQSQTIKENESANSEIMPQKNGFIFDGWYFDDEYHYPYENQPLTQSVVLYAKWIPDETYVEPTMQPSEIPTTGPSTLPSAFPSVLPTTSPSAAPMVSPSTAPTSSPSATPSAAPTATPIVKPTASPTATPTIVPTATPTASPTVTPTVSPTATPTASPTAIPTASPTAIPTASPTVAPTTSPTVTPTASPTATPTTSPTVMPTASPTATPAANPTVTPTASPTVTPTASPTVTPMASPNASSTETPTIQPTAEPTTEPIDNLVYVINDLTFLDENVNVSVSNILGFGAKLIVGSYSSDNVLTDIKSADITTLPGETNNIILKLNLKNAAYVKVFVWDNLDRLKPLAEHVEVSL